MRISLNEFRSAGRHEMSLSAAETWPKTEFQGQVVSFPEPIQLDYRLETQEASLLVQGTVEGKMLLTCSRCLEEFQHPVEFSVYEVFPLDPEEDEEETLMASYFDRDRDQLDLTEFSLLALLERLPLQPLCRQDCRGLCQHCGQNLNQGECDCRQEQLDPRLAVLSQLLKKSGPGKGGVDDGSTQEKNV